MTAMPQPFSSATSSLHKGTTARDHFTIEFGNSNGRCCKVVCGNYGGHNIECKPCRVDKANRLYYHRCLACGKTIQRARIPLLTNCPADTSGFEEMTNAERTDLWHWLHQQARFQVAAERLNRLRRGSKGKVVKKIKAKLADRKKTSGQAIVAEVASTKKTSGQANVAEEELRGAAGC